MLRGTPSHFYQSLNRPFNVLGVDRQLFYLFVALCLPLAFAARLTPIADLIALILFMILHTIGVLITRADQQMLSIYRKHIHYQRYYNAQPGIHAKIPLIKPSVPFYQGKKGLV